MKQPRPANKIGRKRRAAGWTMLALGIIVAGGWVWSGWFNARVCIGNVFACLSRGRASFGVVRPDGPTAWERLYVEKIEIGWVWWEPWYRDPIPHPSEGAKASGLIYQEWLNGWVGYERIDVLFWPLPILLITPAALILRSGITARQRAIKGSCIKCGYSLVGLGVGAACPECGKGAANA